MQEHMIARRVVVTQELITAASMLVRLAHPGNPSLHRALARAEPLLMSQPWRVDEGVLRITSHSTQTQTHKTDGTYCECECTRGVCWHVGAWHILSTLAGAGLHVVADLPLPFALEDEELPGDFLDWFGPDEEPAGAVFIPDPVAFEEVDELPVLPARRRQSMPVVELPPRGQRIITHEPVPGSDYARYQDLCDELFAA